MYTLIAKRPTTSKCDERTPLETINQKETLSPATS